MKKFKVVLGGLILGLIAVATVPAQAKDDKEWAPRSSYVRVLHAIPRGPKVDVYVDSTRILNDVVYASNVTKYIRVPAGYHRIRIVDNNPTRTLYNVSTRLRINRFYTVAAVGTRNNPKVRLIDETRATTNPRQSRVSITHFSAGAPAVDVVGRTVSGRYFKLVSYLRYGQTRTVWLTPGKYDFFVRANGRILKQINNAIPQAGRRYAGYIIGDPNSGGDNGINLLFDVAASQ